MHGMDLSLARSRALLLSLSLCVLRRSVFVCARLKDSTAMAICSILMLLHLNMFRLNSCTFVRRHIIKYNVRIQCTFVD